MSGHDDDSAPPADDPRITPLGDNAGVHIRSEPSTDPVEIDFAGFLVSLGTSGLVNLGRHKNPETGRMETDIEAARQVIHILTMLRDKTQGNLSDDEEQLLKSLLYDLRLAYVEATS